MRQLVCFALSAALVAVISIAPNSAQTPPGGKEDADIIKALEKLANAFNAADAKGVAAAWSEKGEFISEDTGERLEGRKAIEADFAATFAKSKQARLEIVVDKIRRIGGDVASVEGSARVIRPNETILRSEFLALLVKQDGGWLIDSIRESEIPEPESNAVFLEGLAWLNGVWSHSDGLSVATLECEEVANGNFRSHRFSVKSGGEVIHEGTQIVGWDPMKKQMRSWVFSSDGAFGEGVIDQSGKTWKFRVTGVLPNGEKSSATQIITQKDDNNFTFEVIDRHVGIRTLPNVAEFIMSRSTPSAKKGR